MTMEIIKNVGVKLSYCMLCGRPSSVMEMCVKGWDYSFNICDICMRAFLNELETNSNRLIYNSGNIKHQTE